MQTILIVEDDQFIRENVHEILEIEGYNVLQARDGLQGLELAKKHLPDLVVSDWLMPSMDGQDLLEQLREHPPTQNTPFIFLTARSTRKNQREGMMTGADDYLTKPFSADELLTAIASRLERKAVAEEQIAEQVQELHLLRQLDQELSHRMKPEWVITIMMDWALRKTNAKVAVMGTVNETGSAFKVEYVMGDWGAPQPKVGDAWAFCELTELIMRGGKPVLIPDITLIQNLAPVAEQSVSVLGVPVITAEQTLGVIILESPTASAFNDDQLGFLAQMANRAAVALQHAHLFQHLVVQMEKQVAMRELFGRFLTPEVMEALQDNPVTLTGERREVTVMFCDIRGFTSFSEQHTPEQVVTLLNHYLPLIDDASRKNSGNVNKFGGDSAMVVFGAPIEVDNDAYLAVKTALQICDSINAFNLTGISDFKIRAGLGINTGDVIAGAVGPSVRQEYTVIGDTVNLAARIESLNKDYPDYNIFITQSTYESLGERRKEFQLVALGEIAIRGKEIAVPVWAVTGYKTQTIPNLNELSKAMSTLQNVEN